MYFYNANKSHLNRHHSRESRETMADSVSSKLIHLDDVKKNTCKEKFRKSHTYIQNTT